MDKIQVIEKIIADLRKQLDVTREASQEAADYATHEEAKADSKWDTQGLEASYLAAGQAAHAGEIAHALSIFLSYLEAPQSAKAEQALPGSLLECELAGSTQWFFLASEGGGMTVDLDGDRVTVVTPQSPIGHGLNGKAIGASFDLANGNRVEIQSIF